MSLINGELINQIVRIADKVSAMTSLKHSKQVEVDFTAGRYTIACGQTHAGDQVKIMIAETKYVPKESFTGAEPYLIGIDVISKKEGHATHSLIATPCKEEDVFNIPVATAMITEAYMKYSPEAVAKAKTIAIVKEEKK